MNRKEFIRTCGIMCLTMPAIISGCASHPTLQLALEDNEFTLPLSAFQKDQKGKLRELSSVIITNSRLSHPVLVHKNMDGKYSAVLMKCTHQGTELQAFGDRLQCPAHGSEFKPTGDLAQGPAEKDLQNFPVELHNDHLTITII